MRHSRLIILILFLLMTLLTLKYAHAELKVTIAPNKREFQINGITTYLGEISHYTITALDTNQITDDYHEMMWNPPYYSAVRVWALWCDENSLVDCSILKWNNIFQDYEINEPYWTRFIHLLTLCNNYNCGVVEVTAYRSDNDGEACRIPHNDFERLKKFWVKMAYKLKQYGNVLFDLSNEDSGHSDPFSDPPLWNWGGDNKVDDLVEAIKDVDPNRLVSVSLNSRYTDFSTIQGYTKPPNPLYGVDYLGIHINRCCPNDKYNEDTNRCCQNGPWSRTPRVLNFLIINTSNNPLPIFMNEPFRIEAAECESPFRPWFAILNQFKKDSACAKSQGAAGWCFHHDHHAADYPSWPGISNVMETTGDKADERDAYYEAVNTPASYCHPYNKNFCLITEF